MMFRLIVLFGLTYTSFAQNNLFGLYYYSTGLSGYWLDLKPNNFCIIHYPSNCVGSGLPQDTTSWNSLGDTILINVTTEKIISKTYVHKFDGLYPLVFSDSIIPKNISNRLSDHYFLNISGYERIKSYYADGSVQSEVKKYAKKKLEITYYPDGKLKELRQYSKIQKSHASYYQPYGDWYEFYEDGSVKGHSSYKKGKLQSK